LFPGAASLFLLLLIFAGDGLLPRGPETFFGCFRVALQALLKDGRISRK